MEQSTLSRIGKAAFVFDKRVRKAVLPYRHSPSVRAIDWVSKVGDQAQMRVVAGGVVLLGVARGNPRMIGAGIRMLAAHELATAGKDWLKRRVVRTRPRSPVSEGAQKPHPGHDTRKEKSSFPSGHSAGAMASARAFGAVYPAHALAAEAAAGAIGLARIPSCKHYPSDVAAGAAVGAAASAVVGAAWKLVALAITAAAARRLRSTADR
jgi:membrane-associated phospholipid phosphatase